MLKKQFVKKILIIPIGISLLFTNYGLPVNTIPAKADTVTTESVSPEVKNINLNTEQEDGSYAIAGISDPGQPANSQLEGDNAKSNNWGEEKDAEGNVIKSASYVYYGTYQQSSDGAGGYHTDPIKWRVLDADTQDFNADADESHTMFLMSDKVLDWVNFNENKKDGAQIWSTCNLRKWLNSESFSGSYQEGGFLDNAFCRAEQNAILTSSKNANDESEIEGGFITTAKDNCGLSQEGTIDKIFILSAEEANSNAYGFYHQSVFAGSITRSLTATDYAVSKEIFPTTNNYKYWWLRSRVKSSTISSAIVDSGGFLYATNTDGIQSSGKVIYTGVAPAFNLDLSSIIFTSASGAGKSSSFALTTASESKEWNLTMAGGNGFQAARKSSESGAVKAGGAITINIADIGTSYDGVSYTQVSAMLADQNNTVTAYGRIADADAAQAVFTIPEETPDGDYILKVFAEEVNSSSQQNLTDFASNIIDIPISIRDNHTVSITNPQDSHIIRSAEAGNGTEIQGVLKNGGSYTPVVYIADSNYYFPEGYRVMGINGITVTRDSFRQITISGTPTGDVNLLLAPATEKDRQPAPEGLSEADEQITGTTTAMEYRIKPADENSTDAGWTDCTADGTTVAPGTYQVRYQATETKKAGEITEITVLTRYTVTITNPKDSHITRSETAGNGTEQQKVKAGEAIASITYTADEGYYFPENYRAAGQNGITVTRNNATQIMVSGIPARDVSLTLTAAAKKAEPEPTGTPKPGTSGSPTPETSESPEPETSESPEPETSESPEPETSESPEPGTSGSPTPGTTNTPKPGTTNAPKPGTTNAPKPGLSTTPPASAVTVSKTKQEKNALALNAKLKVSQVGSKINVAWGKVSGADGYNVYVQYCGLKYTAQSIHPVTGSKTTKITLKKVNGKKPDLTKNYKVYVVAYKLSNNQKVTLGKTITAHIIGRKNTKYTNVKAVKVKKSSYKLKKGKTAAIRASTVLVNPKKKQLSNAHAKEFRYATNNAKIATVTNTGKIKAIGKGNCVIYVYARNGYAKKVKVTVK